MYEWGGGGGDWDLEEEEEKDEGVNMMRCLYNSQVLIYNRYSISYH